MEVRCVIRSQYHAALDMLGAAIEACPDDVWDRPADENRTWQVAYHMLFMFTFICNQAGLTSFRDCITEPNTNFSAGFRGRRTTRQRSATHFRATTSWTT